MDFDGEVGESIFVLSTGRLLGLFAMRDFSLDKAKQGIAY